MYIWFYSIRSLYSKIFVTFNNNALSGNNIESMPKLKLNFKYFDEGHVPCEKKLEI